MYIKIYIKHHTSDYVIYVTTTITTTKKQQNYNIKYVKLCPCYFWYLKNTQKSAT